MSQDAIVMLKADHKEVRALFREFQKSSTTDARKGNALKAALLSALNDSEAEAGQGRRGNLSRARASVAR